MESTMLETLAEVSVIKRHEVQWFLDLGLGRGVDASRKHPWENKSSFQVRPVLYNDLIGTEHGGSLQKYEQKVTSVRSQEGKIKTSVAIPHSPVKIGLDAEGCRGATNNRRIEGSKVATRTVSFALKFEDRTVDDGAEGQQCVSLSSSGEDETDGPAPARPPLARQTPTSPMNLYGPFTSLSMSDASFEKKLSKWIINRIAATDPSVSIASASVSSVTVTLKSYIGGKFDVLVKHCKNFIRIFGVTHFVTSLYLGAVEYSVYTEAEFMKKFGGGAAVNTPQVDGVSLSGQMSHTTRTNISHRQTIGKIVDGMVKRGADGTESVVGVKLLPVTCLLQEYKLLHNAMKKALEEYFRDKSETFGPFIVTCSDKIFWKVSENCTLEVTDDIKKASSFHIDRNDEDNPIEFMITYSFGDDEEEEDIEKSFHESAYHHIKPVPKYLDTTSSFWGYSEGPLKLKYNVDEKESKLVVVNRRADCHAPYSLSSFCGGKDMFYIKNASKRWSKDGYLCIKQKENGEFVSAILPSMFFHNDESVLMLFRLLPASMKRKPDLFWRRIGGPKRFLSQPAQTLNGTPTSIN